MKSKTSKKTKSTTAGVPAELTGVKVLTKANLYFDGRVASHTVLTPEGEKKTIGLIYPGAYHFGTGAPERMDIVAGACRVKLDGKKASKAYATGETFKVPGNSGFDIAVESGVCEYVCSFLK